VTLSHASANDEKQLRKELNTIDKWRKDYYGANLKTEYPLPELKTNSQIIWLMKWIDYWPWHTPTKNRSRTAINLPNCEIPINHGRRTLGRLTC